MAVVATLPLAVSAAQALAIAQADALSKYRDMTRFRVEITLEPDGWHVKHFVPRDPARPYLTGGGPHHVISADTGEIVSKIYYQ